MGCVGSKDAPLEDGPIKPQTVPSKTQPSHTRVPTKTPDTSSKIPQPLYSGPVVTSAADATVSPTATRSAPKGDADPFPVKQRPPAAQLPRQVSSAAAAQAKDADSDKESDWDQNSQDLGDDFPGSVMERALGHQMHQEHKLASEMELGQFKETTTLRIDKVRGCMFVNQYLVLKFLGRGACGKVFLCLNTLDLHLYAMKALRKVDMEAQPSGARKKRNPLDDLKREIMIMKKIKHLNIVTLSEVIDSPGGSKLLLVMEFMEGGPILTREALERRDKQPEDLALIYFRDMIKALDYLHGKRVVHGDLKPENVLMSASGEVKLSDFGCSKIFATGNEYLERCNGTPAFLAPEMMKPNSRYRGRPTDVYALGACLYTLLFGRIPFSAPNLYKLFQVVQNEPVKYPADVPISDSLRNLLQAMLTKNPKERITLPEVMKDPWVTMGGQFPMRPQKELKAGETQERHSGVPSGKEFSVVNPRADYISGLAMLSRHGRTFNEGEVIMRQGDTGTYLLYIVEGTVDILVRWTSPAFSRGKSSQLSVGTRSHATKGPMTNDLPDESDVLSPIMDDASHAHRTNMLRASTKAKEFVRALQMSAGDSSTTGTPTGHLLIAQRGMGDLVGEMALFSKSMTRGATVRCRTRVVARIVTHEQLVEYLSHHPAGRFQIREGIWRKESEVAMVEALVKLGGLQEVVAASLDDAAAREETAAAREPFVFRDAGGGSMNVATANAAQDAFISQSGTQSTPFVLQGGEMDS